MGTLPLMALLASCGSSFAQVPGKQYVVAVDASADPAHEQEAAYLKAMADHLRRQGFVAGANLRIAAPSNGNFDSDAAAIVATKPDVVHVRNTRMAKRVRSLSPNTPIVFRVGADPVTTGLAVSYARPGRNMTGVVAHQEALMEKRLEIVRELLPKARRLSVLVDLHYHRAADIQVADFLQSRAARLGLQLSLIDVSGSSRDCGRARRDLEASRPEAILVEPPFEECLKDFMALEADLKVPVISGWFDGVIRLAGDEDENLRQAMEMAARILKGSDAGSIPVVRTQRFVLAVDMRRANQLGLEVPHSILLRADRVVR